MLSLGKKVLREFLSLPIVLNWLATILVVTLVMQIIEHASGIWDFMGGIFQQLFAESLVGRLFQMLESWLQ